MSCLTAALGMFTLGVMFGVFTMLAVTAGRSLR